MLEPGDVGPSILPCAVADWEIGYLQTEPGAAEEEVEVAKGVEIAEVGATCGDLLVVVPEQGLRAAESVFHVLPDRKLNTSENSRLPRMLRKRIAPGSSSYTSREPLTSSAWPSRAPRRTSAGLPGRPSGPRRGSSAPPRTPDRIRPGPRRPSRDPAGPNTEIGDRDAARSGVRSRRASVGRAAFDEDELRAGAHLRNVRRRSGRSSRPRSGTADHRDARLRSERAGVEGLATIQ